ncbi:50S ribosomal protein L19e [Candidatus Geothermarchaeota archaeon]|nr:MAG: 50S ribosomal protein L19e [Candidatus Geothermarchaeota archaeon]
MNLNLKKRMVARMLGVGVDRIWFDPTALEELEAIETRRDARSLIKKGIIKILPVKGQAIREKRKRRGPGSRKGKKTAIISKKEKWMMRVRAQRKLLRKLRDEGKLSKTQYRRLYMLVKGGMFRSKAHLLEYIKAHVVKGEL